MEQVFRAGERSVALETTLLVHGVPRGESAGLARELAGIVRGHGVEPAFVGVHAGRAVVGMTEAELGDLLAAEHVEKANTANLGVLMHRRAHAATTVATTMELAAAAGVRVFATGGIGGVHKGYGTAWDVSADLAALTRFPVAVIASGVKSLLDVEATREALETLGVPVIGYGTDAFPAFYLRRCGAGVDARFDRVEDLGAYLSGELSRSGRAVLVANPIPAEHEVSPADLERWLAQAERLTGAEGVTGRGVTPAVLAHLHAVSRGATLRANLALVRSNTDLAARLCASMHPSRR